MLPFFCEQPNAAAREKRLSGALDAHTHFVPRALPSALNRNPRWPSIEMGRDGEAAVTIAGKPFRLIDARSWDADRRLEDMAADGVATQVVSPMPELLSYWFPREDADDFSEHVNHALAELCARRPDCFIGLGMAPLQAPSLAARKLESFRQLGLVGVEIGTHVDGVPLGDPRFDEFYAAAEAAGLCLMVHPLHPAGVERMAGKPPLAALAAFPLETALAATALMTHGILLSRANSTPRLRVCSRRSRARRRASSSTTPFSTTRPPFAFFETPSASRRSSSDPTIPSRSDNRAPHNSPSRRSMSAARR
jgi:aminocarboxymuconate-semialdehyde decarboxylase